MDDNKIEINFIIKQCIFIKKI